MNIEQANRLLADNASAEPEDQAALEQEPQAPAEGQEATQQGQEGDPPQEPGQEGDEQQPKPQHVPLAVHIRERQRHAQERQAWEQQQAIVNQRLQQLFAMQQQAKTQESPPPDKDTDPIGYGIWLNEQTARRLEQSELQRQQSEQQRAAVEQQEKAVRFVAEKVLQDEKDFVARTPDYKDAINALRNVKYAEYMALGMTEEQASQKLQQDAWALSIHAANSGINSAEYAYQLAQALGYKPKAAQGTNVLDMRSKGLRTGVSGGAGGKKTAPTFADLAAMSNEDFAKLTSGDNWRKFAG
jgi:hypothetical protein